MGIYSIYNTLTGEILRVLKTNSDNIFLNLLENEGFIEGDSINTSERVDLETETIVVKSEGVSLIDKSEMLADGVDKVIVSNLEDTNVITVYLEVLDEQLGVTRIEESANSPENGIFEFTTESVGTYAIIVTGFPYLPKTFVITATIIEE